MDFYVVRKYIIILQLICVLFNKSLLSWEKDQNLYERNLFFSRENVSLKREKTIV